MVVGLTSPNPNEVRLLVAFVVPRLAPGCALARAAVVVFAVWRVGMGTRGFGWPMQPGAQGGTRPCGVCGAWCGAQARLCLCDCCRSCIAALAAKCEVFSTA